MIEAVVFTANQKAYLAMRGTDGVARLDDEANSEQGFNNEWSQFRSSLPKDTKGHHVINTDDSTSAAPRVNVVELDEGKGQRSIWDRSRL